MDLLVQLFSDWVGILSFGVVAFIVAMAIYMFKWVGKHVNDEADKKG
ncbi:hypothetical protein imdm_2349 [gamma proteobacterium IMCC2047]|nr:hypothetical protein imdm_2349 [gamma proteobacterium IMCC2047]